MKQSSVQVEAESSMGILPQSIVYSPMYEGDSICTAVLLLQGLSQRDSLLIPSPFPPSPDTCSPPLLTMYRAWLCLTKFHSPRSWSGRRMTGRTRVSLCSKRRVLDCGRGPVVFGIERNAMSEGAPAAQNTERYGKVRMRFRRG